MKRSLLSTRAQQGANGPFSKAMQRTSTMCTASTSPNENSGRAKISAAPSRKGAAQARFGATVKPICMNVYIIYIYIYIYRYMAASGILGYIKKLPCSDVHPRGNDKAGAWNPCDSVHLRILLHVFRANACNVECGQVGANPCKGASVQIRAMRLYACHMRRRAELNSMCGARLRSI